MTFLPFCGYYVFVASLQQRLPENVPGDFFVDSTCIDCETCSQLAPSIFRDHGDQCSVYHQPESEAETQLAMMALVSCPTGSIGALERHDRDELEKRLRERAAEVGKAAGLELAEAFKVVKLRR